MEIAGTTAGAISASVPMARTAGTHERCTAPPGTKGYRGIPTGTNGGQICHNGRTINLGWFDDEFEAAQAYDRAAREYFGAFAYLNFPNSGRIVCLSGTITVRSHASGRIRVRKSESRNPKLETEPRQARVFRPLGHLNFDNCFELRVWDFEFPRSPPWPTGPPGVGHRSLTTSYRFATRRFMGIDGANAACRLACTHVPSV